MALDGVLGTPPAGLSAGLSLELPLGLSRDIFPRRGLVPLSAFIRAMHPKTGISPRPETIRRILESGWIGQLKIHGHRCQLHVPANDALPILSYTRQGKGHRQSLPVPMEKELRRLLSPKKGWNVIDAEWLKPQKKIFLFDVLKHEGKILRALTFPERWDFLPRDYLSPHVKTLPVIFDLAGCLKALASPQPYVEGLVFKSKSRPGFQDSSIIRCRR